MHRLLTSCLLLCLAAPASAQAGPQRAAPPTVRAVRIQTPIHLDGQLDEPVWSQAPVFTDFTQIDPNEGAPVSQPTEVRVVYDDEALYVGARLHDSGPVTARLGRRDMDRGDSDWFGVFLDSFHDHRTAFSFEVNPAGVRRDGVQVADDDDLSWDAVWSAATRVDSAGWTAEIRIPFSQLRFSAAPEQVWGIQLQRVIGRRNERAVASFVPKREQGGVARYGELVGLRGVEPGKRLELVPYLLAEGLYVDPGANPYRGSSEHTFAAGLDLKDRITSNLTLDATLNPDFGQVEVDPAVVNLGVYETRFEEKRPFFVEGSEIFDFGASGGGRGGGGGGQIFYSRRIGRAPQGDAPTDSADVPTATTILGAAKLSGRTANGWSLGVVEALTSRESARYLQDGLTRSAVVEPLTNYFVGRARRDLRHSASAVGGMLTTVNRRLSGSDLGDDLRSAAYTGGVDFRHEWNDRQWALRGALSLSRVLGSQAAIISTVRSSTHYFQRPDADYLSVDSAATSLTGLSAQLELERQAGEHWLGEVSLSTTTPGYEVNDLGFNSRTDRRDAEIELNYVENQPGDFLREWSMGGSARYEGNYGGQMIQGRFELEGGLTTLGYWDAHLNLGHQLRAYDDRLTRGGPLALRPAGNSVSLFLSSDSRKPVSIWSHARLERSEFGGGFNEVGVNVNLRLASNLRLSVGPELSHDFTAAQYLETRLDSTATATFGRRYLFAPLHRTELSLETRLDWTFRPGLSLQVYAQPLLSSGRYGEPLQLTKPRTYPLTPYEGTVGDRDFNLRSLRGNAILRWEWRRGSTLYLAWQQSREGVDERGDFELSRDARALFGAPPDNIFLLKVDYWWNP